MKILVLFAVTVLFGVGECDNKANCWLFTSIGCTLDLNGRNQDNSFCGRHRQEMYCIADPAIGCDMSFKSKAENLKNIWDGICEKDTDKQRELDKNIECFKKVEDDPKCTKSSAKEEKYDELNRCRNFDETKECKLQSVKDNCGEATVALYKTVFDPMLDFQRAVCEDVILPAEDNLHKSKRSARAARPRMFGSMGRIFTLNNGFL